MENPVCYIVEQGDVLGIFIKSIPSPITYIQNFNNPNTLRKKFNNANKYPEIGDIVQMDTLNFPYQFSIYMSVDIGDIGSNNGGDCSAFYSRVQAYRASLPEVTTVEVLNLVGGTIIGMQYKQRLRDFLWTWPFCTWTFFFLFETFNTWA